MVFGTQFHTYILENEKFQNEVIIKDFDLRKKADKEEVEKLNGASILKTKDYELINKMSLAIDKLPIKLIDFDNENKVEAELHFELYDLKCRSKVDFIDFDNKRIIDLKTIANIKDAERVARYDYGTQLCFYKHAVQAYYEGDWECFVLFVDKTDNPDAVIIQYSDVSYYDDWIYTNLMKYKNWLETKDVTYELYKGGHILI
jgi:hypothetical protein